MNQFPAWALQCEFRSRKRVQRLHSGANKHANPPIPPKFQNIVPVWSVDPSNSLGSVISKHSFQELPSSLQFATMRATKYMGAEVPGFPSWPLPGQAAVFSAVLFSESVLLFLAFAISSALVTSSSLFPYCQHCIEFMGSPGLCRVVLVMSFLILQRPSVSTCPSTPTTGKKANSLPNIM